MSKIHYELKEIPVPEYAHSKGNRVCIKIDVGDGKTQEKSIGIFANKKLRTFHVNDWVRIYLPDLWEIYYGSKDITRHQIGIGHYVLLLAIGHTSGLLPMLYDTMGPEYANAYIPNDVL